MRYSDQLGSLVKNVSAELTLDEHQRLKKHVEKDGKPVNAFLREIVLQAITSATAKPRSKRTQKAD
jgi:predicted DNA-binding protein